ncbi:MAG: hypothetical protein MUF27_14940, partial [Acidobacteria bacterium]|nr:hypothetical protein [Acidobacteriota bacterium]
MRVSRYDELDRKVFESVWLSESAYPGTGSWPVDRNGGGDDYRIDGVPVQGANRPLGTVVFFGTRKPGCGAHNPLCIDPDPLGRVRRIENPDGSVADISYVGPHETVAIYQDADGNGVADAGTDPPVIYKYYRDGLGRTVMVDAPSGADAIYDYNVSGKLTGVRLVSQLPGDPFTKWLNNDALLARMRSATVPESGRAAAGGVTSYLAYDNAGNLLEWEDPLAAARGATFRQYFDVAGRRTALTRVKTSASRPLADDAGGFEIDSTNWKEGSGDSSFIPGETAWEIVPYSALPGVLPPSAGSGTSALRFGSAGGYDSAATGVQTIRRRVDGVGRDDVLSFELWRQVREGVSSLDRLEVAVALVNHGNDQDTSYRRIVLTLDSSHSSFPRWQRYSLRPMDLLANNIALNDYSHDIYVLFSFDKGSMTPSTNPLVGVVIDNVRLGRDAEEVIGEWAYDGNEPDADDNPLTNSITGPMLAETQLDAVEATDRKQGKLTAAIGYLDGQPVDVRRFVYRGRNGRLSGEEHDIDWTAAAGRDLASGWSRWVSRYVYAPHGGIERLVAPGIPGDTFERAVTNSYKREFLSVIETPGWGAVLELTSYGANGVATGLLFRNGTEETVTLDQIGRLQSMQVLRPAQSGLISAWNSGNFAFDGRGNITAIGAQTFIYDSADRLIDAKVLPQAQNPGQTVPEHLTYTHDEYGNVTSQDRVSGFLSQVPTGLEFSRTYDAKNHPEPASGTFTWSFDLNGNATRYPGKAGQDVSSIWTDLNQLAGFFEGSIDTVSAVPALRSIYGVDGLRVVTQALGRPGEEGWPRLTLRDPGGRPLAEFVQRPDRPQPSLDRDFIYGVGRLLAERQPST